jgi:hypothetical protein
MKKIKLLVIFLLLLFVTSTQAQLRFGKAYYDNAIGYYLDGDALDSISMVNGIYTEWIDWSFIQTNVFYISSCLVQANFDATAKCDTIWCIMQGIDPAGNPFDIDTISGGYGTTTAGSESIVSNTSQVAVGKYISPNYGNMFWTPKIRFQFKEKMSGATTRHVYNDGLIYLALIGKTNYIPTTTRIPWR